jgi:hypothetical protein
MACGNWPSHQPTETRLSRSQLSLNKTITTLSRKDNLNRHIRHMHKINPFAAETLGPFGEEVIALVKDLGKRLIESTGEPRSCAYLIQRISHASQRGNAASILATVPTSSKFQEVFYL